MRTTLLIGLMVLGVAASAGAQAQTGRRAYDPPKPYELPKEYRTNPHEWDYSKPDPATKGPGYRNVDGSLPTQRRAEPFFGAYGSRSSGSSGYSGASSRNPPNPNCSKPGVVC